MSSYKLKWRGEERVRRGRGGEQRKKKLREVDGEKFARAKSDFVFYSRGLIFEEVGTNPD